MQLANAVFNNSSLWPNTVVMITTDESGGYYDSGYIQPIDFFGDGPRVPFIVISPYAKQGFVDHTYYDSSSILKFIEENWGLRPLSARTRIISLTQPLRLIPTNLRIRHQLAT